MAAIERSLSLWSLSVQRVLGRIGLYLLVAWFTFLASFPFIWMAITAFKQNSDLYNIKNNPFLFNALPTLDHVKLLFSETLFTRWLVNTALVATAVVIITLVTAVPAGYSLARLTGRWGRRLGFGIFLTYLIPPTLLFIPFSRVIAILGLQNSLWALVLVYPTFTIPFCTWLLMGFFRSIPRDIEEQAMIDGYSRLSAMRKVVLPLAVSGVLTAAFFSFTLVMQEFVYALTFISSVGKMTVSLGIPVALFRDVFNWGAMMAAALITSVPIAVVYNLFIDRFVAGLTGGAVKG